MLSSTGAAKRTKDGRYGRVTGRDPAGPEPRRAGVATQTIGEERKGRLTGRGRDNAGGSRAGRCGASRVASGKLDVAAGVRSGLLVLILGGFVFLAGAECSELPWYASCVGRLHSIVLCVCV